jgi:hypothetical protein
MYIYICSVVNGDDSEWSSLKEVWAWVMRSTVLTNTTGCTPTMPSLSSSSSSLKRKITNGINNGPYTKKDDSMLLNKCGFTVGELFDLADVVEHTSLCDPLLSGSVEEDVSIHEVEDILLMIEDIKQLYHETNEVVVVAGERNVTSKKKTKTTKKKNTSTSSKTSNSQKEKKKNGEDRMESKRKLLNDAMLRVLNSVNVPDNVSRLNVRQEPNQVFTPP